MPQQPQLGQIVIVDSPAAPSFPAYLTGYDGLGARQGHAVAYSVGDGDSTEWVPSEVPKYNITTVDAAFVLVAIQEKMKRDRSSPT